MDGRLVAAYTLMLRLQHEVANMAPRTSLRLPINLTMTADSMLITMNIAPANTWKQSVGLLVYHCLS